jgi:uncharacterized protein involved in exopolysaccharide biosynthesis
MNARPESSEDGDTIDSRRVIAALRAKRWWVLGSVVVFAALFAAAAFWMTPIYRSTAILVPASSSQASGGLGSALGELGGIASLAGINVGSRTSATEEALAVLRSREFTQRFISDEHLMTKLFQKKWDASAGKWKGEPPTLDKAYRYFNTKIRSVDQDKKTGLITLQIDWRDRNEAAAWANELVRRVNEDMRARAIADADASLGYLDKELEKSNVVTTHEAVGHLIESQVKQRMLANVSKEFVFRVVDPGMPADADDPIKPQKMVMIAAGITLGLMVGVVFALVSDGSRRRAEAGFPTSRPSGELER